MDALKMQTVSQRPSHSREAEQIAKEFAGTQFKLPERAQMLVPQALRLISQSGLPTNPKPIDILDASGDLLPPSQAKQSAAMTTYAGRKPEQNKRAGIQDLFGVYNASPEPSSNMSSTQAEENADERTTAATSREVSSHKSPLVTSHSKIVNEDSV